MDDDSIAGGLAASRRERFQPQADVMLQQLDQMAAQQSAPSTTQAPTAPRPSSTPPASSPSVVGEAAKAVVGGVRDGAQQVWHTIDEAATWLNNNFLDLRIGDRSQPAKTGEALGFQGELLPQVAENQTLPGKMARSVFQFVPEFIAANKALAVTRLGAVTKAATAGAIADFSGFDPHEKRVSDMVLELTDGDPMMGKSVFEYLSANPMDSNAEGRFKNALEGLGLGIAAEGIFRGLKATKTYFTAKGEDPREAIEAIAKAPTEDVLKVGNADADDAVADQLQAQNDALGNPEVIPAGAQRDIQDVLAEKRASDEQLAFSVQDLSPDQLREKISEAKAHNEQVELDTVRELFGEEGASEFAALSARKKGSWLDDNLTGEQYEVLSGKQINETLLEDFLNAGQRFELGSAEELGQSIALLALEADKEGFATTASAYGLKQALQYAGQQGWDFKAVLKGMRERSTAWAGADAQELFPRLFKTLEHKPEVPKALPPSVEVTGDAKVIDAIEGALPKVDEAPAPKVEPTPTPVVDPVVRQLERPEVAGIAPTMVARKAPPKIAQAKVTKLMEAAQSGTMKDIADTVESSDFNFDHLDTDEDIRNLIDATSKVFEKEVAKASGGVQTLKETQELADMLGTSQSSLKELYGDTENLAARVTANRVLLAASAKKTSELARYASSGDAQSLLAFRKQIMLHSTIQSQMKGVQTEVARALSAMRIQANAADLVVNEVDDLLASLGGREVNLEFAKKMATTTDPAKLNAIARKGAMARTKDAVFEAWVNGLLSGPTTHIANVIGNSTVALFTSAEKATASAVGKIFRGGARDRIELGEVQAHLFGMMEGLKDSLAITAEGLRASGQALGSLARLDGAGAKDILKTNEGEFGNAYKAFVYDTPILDNALYGTKEFDLQTPAITGERFGIDPNTWGANIVDALGALVRLPGRALTTSDEIFKAMHYRADLKAQAYRQAKAEGRTGDELAARIAELVETREAPLKGDSMSASALEAARKGTFTDPLGEAGRAFQNAMSKVPGARYIFPFVRTPANIMNYAWERTPLLNVLNQQIRDDYMAGGARRDMAVAKTAIGGAIYATAAQLAAGDVIVGGMERNLTAERLGGRQPYSVKIGDTYYAFSRLDPVGMMMGLAADFTALSGNLDENQRNDMGAAMITALSNNLLSKSYLSSVTELFTAIGEAQRLGTSEPMSRFLDRQAASFIPFSSALRTARREDDPVVREVWDLMDAIKNTVPGYSKTLAPHRNVFGEPVVYGGGLGPDIASPIYTSTETDSPAGNEIARLNVDLQLPSKTIGGGSGRQSIDLTHAQYDRLTELAGNGVKVFQNKGFKDWLDEYVQTDAYKRLSESQGDYTGSKQLVIQHAHAAAKKAATAQLLEEFPGLKQRYIQNLTNRGKALSGNPVVPILEQQ